MRLIAAAGRNGLRRTYTPEVLERLALITCARSAGFSIAEIGRFVAARPTDAELRVRMATRARDLDEQVGRLTRLRDSLRPRPSVTTTDRRVPRLQTGRR
ncbi:MerR family DNA-binding protein [Streptomyces sp. ALB3]|uniref:MerR family DNA-binding protein n=1 Tax=Streptomyces sp. ALB3 TaxID=3374278 RepID=UPI00379AEBC5